MLAFEQLKESSLQVRSQEVVNAVFPRVRNEDVMLALWLSYEVVTLTFHRIEVFLLFV